MIENFEKDYEVCNCHKVKLNEIIDAISIKKIETLRELQEVTGAGTHCRHCVFEEADLGKVKKKIYCKDIFNEVKYG
ncbi:bacterioferritin-associated ferredoxin [Arcobacter sp. LA11]|uniref:(2Fe-2S)-binding protein n=1 Tax=Arcobacter sp. LA11 TaxID=1898176 RepID=UPI000933AA10|nr:(2Fe-2S)-binding protein [Arcobacter sp. LA11]